MRRTNEYLMEPFKPDHTSTGAKYADDASGLEKILRFGQYAALTFSALPTPTPDVRIVWTQVRGQFALTRRFFRLLKWYGCFIVAFQTFQSDKAPAEKLCLTAKWSFLGLYLFFEMFAITNAMNITSSAWAQWMQREALKFWLYSIVSSIFVSLCQLWFGPAKPAGQQRKTKSRKGNNEKQKQSVPVQNAVQAAYSKIYIQLLIDCADVLIPVAFLEWAPIDELFVGMAGSLTSILAGRDVWNRVQAQASIA